MEFRQNSTAMLDNQTEEEMDNEMRTGGLWLSVGIGGGIYIYIYVYIYIYIYIVGLVWICWLICRWFVGKFDECIYLLCRWGEPQTKTMGHTAPEERGRFSKPP